MSQATASIRGYERNSPHGFACIDQHSRNFPICIIEFENKSDESHFFLFTTFDFRLPAASRMVATSSPYWVNHDGRLLHSVLWRSVRQRGDIKACYQPSELQHSRFTLPQMLSLAPLPLIAAAAWVGTLRSESGQHDRAPPVCAILLFLASLGGLGANVWPYTMPCVLNIWDAASEHRTQVISFFAFTGFVPVILAYVGFSYWTFRGKVGAPLTKEAFGVVALNEILRA